MTAAVGIAIVATIVNTALIVRSATTRGVDPWATAIGLVTAALAVGLLVLSVQPFFGDHPTVAERRWTLLAIATIVATSAGAVAASRCRPRAAVVPVVAATTAGALAAAVVAGLTLPAAVPG